MAERPPRSSREKARGAALRSESFLSGELRNHARALDVSQLDEITRGCTRDCARLGARPRPFGAGRRRGLVGVRCVWKR